MTKIGDIFDDYKGYTIYQDARNGNYIAVDASENIISNEATLKMVKRDIDNKIKRENIMVENDKNDEKIKTDDWVRVSGESTEAFRVEWIKGESVGLCNGCTELLHKITKLDPDKYQINSYVTHYWRKICKYPKCIYYVEDAKHYCCNACASDHYDFDRLNNGE